MMHLHERVEGMIESQIILGGLRTAVKEKRNWLIFPALVELGEQRNRYLA
jgi:hypothetical protein